MAIEYKKIQEVHMPEFDLSLTLGNFATECYISISPKGSGIRIHSYKVFELLKKRGIVKGVNREFVRELCHKVEHGHHIHSEQIAQGVLPSRDRDGFIDFKVRVSAEKADYEEDAAGSVDFKNLRLFDNVEKGDIIAEIQKPERAKDGWTVMGSTIPCKPNAVPPVAINVKVGDGARYADAEHIEATMSGRVIHEGGKIFMTDEYVVREDVDFDVGHIDFIGHVKINGDVVDGFNVKAGKSLKIRSNVGRCELACDGDIELGGMTGEGGVGMGNSKIHCKGNIQARYLRNVDVECEGNVEILREAMHCNIKCAGIVSIRGTVAGGEIIALGGVEVGTSGTSAGIPTEVISGKDYRIEEKRKKLTRRIEANERQQKAVDKLIGPYLSVRDPAAMKDEYREKLKKALYQAQKLKLQHEDSSRQLRELNEHEVSNRANAKINIQKVLHHGSILTLGQTRKQYEAGLKGPVSLIEHRGDDIIPIKLSSLQKNARQLEMDLIQKEYKEGYREGDLKPVINVEGAPVEVRHEEKPAPEPVSNAEGAPVEAQKEAKAPQPVAVAAGESAESGNGPNA
ncbi:hypothetical protein BVY04_03585 [bacterium M21]|nr:hypothetical protein BVY04_03585 [bacterium M21]